MTLPEVITDNGPIDRNFRALDQKIDSLEAVTAPTFATSWSNFGAPYSNAGYYIDRGRVYLRGAVKNGGAGTGLIFTLPSGYRPPATVMLRTPTANITIASTGTVTDSTFDAFSKALTNLDGISFRIT